MLIVEDRPLGLIDPILPSIEQTIGNRGVGVDSAVAEEGPVAADVFEGLEWRQFIARNDKCALNPESEVSLDGRMRAQ